MPRQRGKGRLDYTARREVQEQLFILSRAIQQSPNALLIARVDGFVEYVNPSFTRLTGYTAEEVMGQQSSVSPFAGPIGTQYRNLKGTLREGRTWRGEVEGERKNGERYWVQESISPILSPEGEVTHFLVIRQDITQQKLDHAALEESEQRFRQVAEMTGEWLWEQDTDGRYIYCSGAVSEILGYRPEEIIGMRYFDLLMPEDNLRWQQEFPEMVESCRGFCRLLNHYRHRDGHEVFTESTGEPVLDPSGRIIKWRGVDHDITARKHYEDALRLRNRAIEAASVGICIADAQHPNTPNIYVNPALCRLTGYSKDELMGQNMRILHGEETDPIALREIRGALMDGRGCEVVVRNYRKGGIPFWNELLIDPVRDANGRLTHFIGIQADVTERLRAESERKELDIARRIQLSLLPKAPLRTRGVEVAGVCLPASHVGGDYYDFFQFQDHLDVVIADVSGHSVGAALIMAEARSTLKAATRNAENGGIDHGPGDVLRVLNELLYEDLDGADLFISMFYLRYDYARRVLRYGNGGHNRPLLLRQEAPSCELLDTEGLILGVSQTVDFEEKQVALSPGDRVLLYTDGITEAQSSEGEFFGSARLCEMFVTHRDKAPQEVVEALFSDLRAFLGGKPFKDDVTLVVLQAGPETTSEPA